MNDDEFGTIKQNMGVTVILSLAIVLAILWLALRSIRIVLAVVVTVAAGLAMSAAAGLFLVGAFNLISIAFFTLFVGLGVDFAIQFSVRYRAERHEHHDLGAAFTAQLPRLAFHWRLPPWRSLRDLYRLCRPPIWVFPSSAKLPA